MQAGTTAAAGYSYKQASRKLLVLTRDAQVPEVPKGVIVQPAYLWLLSPESK
jgi:hypothetical protein